jgi:predicted DNA-binding protein (MmcQ/YjbR family)
MPSEAATLAKLRKVCARMPGVSETVTFGHPAFQVAKKTFAVLEEYKGELGIALKVEKVLQPVFLKDSRFFLTPYSGRHGWVTFRVNAAPLDWKEIRGLLDGSYRLVRGNTGTDQDRPGQTTHSPMLRRRNPP